MNELVSETEKLSTKKEKEYEAVLDGSRYKLSNLSSYKKVECEKNNAKKSVEKVVKQHAKPDTRKPKNNSQYGVNAANNIGMSVAKSRYALFKAQTAYDYVRAEADRVVAPKNI